VYTVVVGATVGGGIALVPGTAGADARDTCDSGEFCLWENKDFNNDNPDGDHVHQWVNNNSNYTDDNWWDVSDGAWTSEDVDNEASSARNAGTQCDVWLWQDVSYDGAVTKFALGGKADGDLGNDSVGDNRASSHHWCTSS
jgi:hypothetical protein